MKKIFTFVIIAAAASLAACGSKTDANAKNFGAAISQHLEQTGLLCLNTDGFPLVPDSKRIEGQMAVLEKIDLVRAEDAEVDEVHFLTGRPTGKMRKVRRYALADAAKPFAKEKKRREFGPKDDIITDLCWGKRVLDKVVKWDAPMKLGDYQETHVTYTYKIANFAEWANNPEVQEAFPYIKNILDDDKEAHLKVHLTSEGWEH